MVGKPTAGRRRRVRCEACGGADVNADDAGFYSCGDCGQIQTDIRDVDRDEDDVFFEIAGTTDVGAGQRLRVRNVGETTLQKAPSSSVTPRCETSDGQTAGLKSMHLTGSTEMEASDDQKSEGSFESDVRELDEADPLVKLSKAQKVPHLRRFAEWKPKEGIAAEFDFLRGWQVMLQYICLSVIDRYGITEWMDYEAKRAWESYLKFVSHHNLPLETFFNCQRKVLRIPGSRLVLGVGSMALNFEDSILADETAAEQIKEVVKYMGVDRVAYMKRMLPGNCGRVSKRQKALGALSAEELSADDSEFVNANARSLYSRSGEMARQRVLDRQQELDYNPDLEEIRKKKRRKRAKKQKESRIQDSCLGVSRRGMRAALNHRQLSQVPSEALAYAVVGPSSPKQVAYLVDVVYEHDFLFFLRYGTKNSSDSTDCRVSVVSSCPLTVQPLPDEDFVNSWESFLSTKELKLSRCNKCFYKSMRLIGRSRNVLSTFSHICGRTLCSTALYSSDIPAKIPKIDSCLLLALFWISLLNCRYAITAEDILKWTTQGKIPLAEASRVIPPWLFEHGRGSWISSGGRPIRDVSVFQTDRLPTARMLESTVLELRDCGVDVVKLNAQAFIRRLIFESQLPEPTLSQLSTLLMEMLVSGGCIRRILDRTIRAKRFLNEAPDDRSTQAGTDFSYGEESRHEDLMSPKSHGANSQDNTDYQNNVSKCLRSLNRLFGEGIGGYPVHIVAAATVLAASRLVWSVLAFQPPAPPLRFRTGSQCSTRSSEGLGLLPDNSNFSPHRFLLRSSSADKWYLLIGRSKLAYDAQGSQWSISRISRSDDTKNTATMVEGDITHNKNLSNDGQINIDAASCGFQLSALRALTLLAATDELACDTIYNHYQCDKQVPVLLANRELRQHLCLRAHRHQVQHRDVKTLVHGLVSEPLPPTQK